jgi:ubiquitin-protein ligase
MDVNVEFFAQLLADALANIDIVKREHQLAKPWSRTSDVHAEIGSIRNKKTGGWAKGTGFGGTRGSEKEIFRSSQAYEYESKLDTCLQEVLNTLNEYLRQFNNEVTELGVEMSGATVRSYCDRMRTAGLDAKSHTALLWLLQEYLRNDSLVDIGSRKVIYQELLIFVSLIARSLIFLDVLTVTLGANTRVSALSLLKTLSSQAKVYLQLNQRLLENDSHFAADENFDFNHWVEDNQNGNIDTNNEIIEALAMALHIEQTFEDMTRCTECAQSIGIDLSVEVVVGSGAVAINNPEKCIEISAVAHLYVQTLGGLRFEAVDMIDTIGLAADKRLVNCSHVFLQPNCSYDSHYYKVLTTASVPKQRMSRVAKEMSSLLTNLPIELGSSIFVRCDEARQDILKALIIGPEGTPYANGCFEFDIQLPPTYPDSPPMVKLVTTGGGRVRFNPNLYADGKVCLSLLGTWSGPSWDPKVSTLLQVLISIQSLVMVPDPYFNEPSYETSMRSPQGKAASEQYNSDIHKHTAQFAIAEQIAKPSYFFSNVIRSHFKIKSGLVRDQLLSWKLPKESLETVFLELKGLLDVDNSCHDAELAASLDKLLADSEQAKKPAGVAPGTKPGEYLPTDTYPQKEAGAVGMPITADGHDDLKSWDSMPAHLSDNYPAGDGNHPFQHAAYDDFDDCYDNNDAEDNEGQELYEDVNDICEVQSL